MDCKICEGAYLQNIKMLKYDLPILNKTTEVSITESKRQLDVKIDGFIKTKMKNNAFLSNVILLIN